jgi:hypothetical protein
MFRPMWPSSGVKIVIIRETAALVVADVVCKYFPQMRTYVCNTYEISLRFLCTFSFYVICGYLFCVLNVVAVCASFGCPSLNASLVLYR